MISRPENTNSLPEIEGLEIIEQIGKGASSYVYKARQKILDRLVVAKVLSPLAIFDQESMRRFQNEAKQSSLLNHPNIVSILSYGVSADGRAYLVMEYAEGHSLAEELERNGRLTLEMFRDIFSAVLAGLGNCPSVRNCSPRHKT